MNSSPNPFPDAEPGIDAIVRAQLDAEAARTDAGAFWAGVHRRLAEDNSVTVSPRRRWQRWAVMSAMAGLAAMLLLGIFYVPPQREAMASPTEVVQAARAVYTQGSTRCYRVTLTLPGRIREKYPLLTLANDTRTLCTRGDCFVVEPGFGGKGAWGRDASSRIWVAFSDGAAVFEETELPPPLRQVIKIHELELGPLLDDVLADFDLDWSEPPTSDTYTISATRHTRAGPFHMASAQLVIEKDTKVIRSLTVVRQLMGEETATGTFTLLNSVDKDAAFAPEAHLKAGLPVYDRSKHSLRRRLVFQHFGALIGNAQ